MAVTSRRRARAERIDQKRGLAAFAIREELA